MSITPGKKTRVRSEVHISRTGPLGSHAVLLMCNNRQSALCKRKAHIPSRNGDSSTRVSHLFWFLTFNLQVLYFVESHTLTTLDLRVDGCLKHQKGMDLVGRMWNWRLGSRQL